MSFLQDHAAAHNCTPNYMKCKHKPAGDGPCERGSTAVPCYILFQALREDSSVVCFGVTKAVLCKYNMTDRLVPSKYLDKKKKGYVPLKGVA